MSSEKSVVFLHSWICLLNVGFHSELTTFKVKFFLVQFHNPMSHVTVIGHQFIRNSCYIVLSYIADNELLDKKTDHCVVFQEVDQ